jgi:DNA-binding NarL/FixJ family response regulator
MTSTAPMKASGAQKADQRQYRIAIAEDNELMREGISCVVARGKGFKICGFAVDKNSTLALVEEKKPDALLLSFFLHDCDGMDLVKDLAARFPQTRVVVTGAGSQELYAERLLRAGASACLPAHATARDLINALWQAVAPKRSFSRQVRHRDRGSGSSSSSIWALTDRELHVFRLIGRGTGTGEIARQLGLSRKTIEYYREQIKSKLGYRDTGALRKGAFEWAQRGS